LRGATLPVTAITVNGNGGARVYGGVGAILGGGGNARYLEDYPPAQQSQILDYLFKPGYGASLQLLKLEIGGDGNSSDGAEPSVEHTAGNINCAAGYEFAIAQQAVARNPDLKLYGLQWGAPGWVGDNGSLFTSADIRYLLDWLGCAKQNGLTISYLGGWNERDNGSHASWVPRAPPRPQRRRLPQRADRRR
jgi:Glycosyl hydrolase family 59